jgi:hypothetical protein
MKSSPQTGKQTTGGNEIELSISSHPKLVYRSGHLLFRNEELKDSANFFLNMIPKGNTVHEIVRRITQIPLGPAKIEPWLNNLGKLSVKEEAAGFSPA